MHKDSKLCRYDGMCERELCMHRKEESKSENICSTDNVNDELVKIIDLGDSEDEIENEATETNGLYKWNFS
jgi:predicted transcriptional regulator